MSQWVIRHPIQANLKVQMRAGRPASAAAQRDNISHVHLLPADNVDLAQVGIQCLIAIAMVDSHGISIANSSPTGKYNYA